MGVSIGVESRKEVYKKSGKKRIEPKAIISTSDIY